jgi:hypothetical protein
MTAWHEGPCCPSCREDDGTEWALDAEHGECCCYAIDLLTGEPYRDR